MFRTGFFLFGFLAVAVLLGVPQHADAKSIIPSFPCKYAKLSAEKAICASNRLSALDTVMVALYEVAHARVSQKRAFEEDQTAWRQDRNRCGSNRRCIARSYRLRIAELEAIARVRLKPGRNQDQQQPAAQDLSPGDQVTRLEGWCAEFRRNVLQSSSRCTGIIRNSCDQECSIVARFSIVDGRNITISGAEETYEISGRNGVFTAIDNCWINQRRRAAFCYGLFPDVTGPRN